MNRAGFRQGRCPSIVGTWGLLLGLAACDSKATATDPTGGARAEQKSKEYESCGASMHCQDDLRCFDQVCRRGARSIVGDYLAAAGAAARTRGELEAAISSYTNALNQYGVEKVAVPPDIECAYGATLAVAKSKPDYAERAARVLHRCVTTVPVGSSMRERALAQLATLADVGLDPLLLGNAKPAEVYLTLGAARPATEKLQISVSATPQPTGKQWPKVTEKLGDLRGALVDCWVKHNEATKKPELAVSFGLKVSYKGNPDYEEEGFWETKVEGDDACMRPVVEPAFKALKLTERLDSKLTITIK